MRTSTASVEGNHRNEPSFPPYWFYVLLLQPSTPVSPPSPWRRMHHRRGRTSHHATARHRAARNPFLACTLAASHPHKQGWGTGAKVTEKSSLKNVGSTSRCSWLTPTFSLFSTLLWLPLSVKCSFSGFHSYFCLSCHRSFPLQGTMSSGKQGSVPLSQTAEKRPEDPRTLQQRRYKSLQHTILFVMMDCLEVKQTIKNLTRPFYK